MSGNMHSGHTGLHTDGRVPINTEIVSFIAESKPVSKLIYFPYNSWFELIGQTISQSYIRDAFKQWCRAHSNWGGGAHAPLRFLISS